MNYWSKLPFYILYIGLAAKGAKSVFEQSWIILYEYKRFTLSKSIFNSIYQCEKTKGK